MGLEQAPEGMNARDCVEALERLIATPAPDREVLLAEINRIAPFIKKNVPELKEKDLNLNLNPKGIFSPAHLVQAALALAHNLAWASVEPISDQFLAQIVISLDQASKLIRNGCIGIPEDWAQRDPVNSKRFRDNIAKYEERDIHDDHNGYYLLSAAMTALNGDPMVSQIFEDQTIDKEFASARKLMLICLKALRMESAFPINKNGKKAIMQLIRGLSKYGHGEKPSYKVYPMPEGFRLD